MIFLSAMNTYRSELSAGVADLSEVCGMRQSTQTANAALQPLDGACHSLRDPQKFMQPSPASHIHGVIHPGQGEPQLYSCSEYDADVCVV